jgi:hypothetical protein
LRDTRSFRVALIAEEFVNPGPGGIDGLSVLGEEGWGAIPLPPASCPNDVANEILEHIGDEVEEFFRNRYDLVLMLIGSRDGIEHALLARNISAVPTIRPTSTEEIRAFLTSRPPPPAGGQTEISPRAET